MKQRQLKDQLDMIHSDDIGNHIDGIIPPDMWHDAYGFNFIMGGLMVADIKNTIAGQAREELGELE